MGACPHRHARPVNDRCHVMGMGAVHVERDNGTLVLGAAKNAERVDLREPLGGVIASALGGPLVFSFAGILVASLIANIPFAVQPIARAFEGIPENVREAAYVSGLSPWETFKKIELPLAWPGIFTALALVFVHTLGEFGVVLMMGGNIPGATRTLSIAIYDSVQGLRTSDAALMSAAVVAIALVTIASVLAVSRRRNLFSVSNRL